MDNTRLNTLLKIIGVIAFILRFVAQCEIPKSQRKPDYLITSKITTCHGTMDNELSAGQYSEEIGKLEVTDQQKIVAQPLEKEYLKSLQEFHRTTGKNEKAIKTDDVVHIHNDKFCRWKLAIVEELVTENDGHVRSAVVRTNTGHTKRPIVQLYPSEVDGKTDFVLTNDSIDHVNFEKKHMSYFIRKRSISTSE
ncbi:unnamed protein product [Mytilus coruscus]|uniref:DUF5641 domain-containing protein n=1 Tax=Mytilus coruscus TaxID=42192 RepID=A0A6J8D9C7_MYTCO|nr:unnamed protein product [Mytilus coruscus]